VAVARFSQAVGLTGAGSEGVEGHSGKLVHWDSAKEARDSAAPKTPRESAKSIPEDSEKTGQHSYGSGAGSPREAPQSASIERPPSIEVGCRLNR